MQQKRDRKTKTCSTFSNYAFQLGTLLDLLFCSRYRLLFAYEKKTLLLFLQGKELKKRVKTYKSTHYFLTSTESKSYWHDRLNGEWKSKRRRNMKWNWFVLSANRKCTLHIGNSSVAGMASPSDWIEENRRGNRNL